MKKEIRQDFVEESVLLGSTIKWIILSIFVGLTVGATVAGFIKVVDIGVKNVSEWSYFYLLLPIGFFISSYIVMKLAPDAEGHGTEKAIEAIHKRSGRMDIKAIPVKIVATFVTIISGGSVGEEGPATQIGAGIASFFAGIFKMDNTDRKRFAICGISAGFVGVFGAPIGAAVFAAEVLYIGRFSYMSLMPSLIASYVSYFTGRALGTNPLIYYVNYYPKSPSQMFVRMVTFGIFIGLISMLFVRMVNGVEGFFHKLKIYKPFKAAIGGLILIAVVYITGTTMYLGLGDEVTRRTVAGGHVSGLAFLVKMFTTSVTLGSGGNGGILTPMLYIGTVAGSSFADMIQANASFYSAVGMVSFMAACSNTPLAGIIMGMEIFGPTVGSYASIVCVISYLIVGHKSVYPTQVLFTTKSPSFDMKTNCELDKIHKFKVRNRNETFKKFLNQKKNNDKKEENNKENI